jgi:hypothetical protein
MDKAYNYGYFSTSQENFIPNFMIGKPMYMLGVTPFTELVYEYAMQGRSVVEQELNMTDEEVLALMKYLDWNALPENAEYQYNYFFDNCATRPRDLIEQFAGDGIDYQVDPESLPTFREATRQCSGSNRWYTFGTDLCLGVQSDGQMTVHDAAFVPALLEQSLDLARRKDTGEPIVLAKRTIVPQTQIIEQPLFDGPMVAILGVVLLYFVFYLFLRRKTVVPWRVLRCLIYLILGLGGIILWFLSFVSAHPHTFFNANTVLFHPFWLILVGTLWNEVKHAKLNRWLYWINFGLTIIYLGLGYMQTLPVGMAYLAILVGFDQFLCAYLIPRRKRAE